ncbi:P-loop containing nucleoside triphosphate hydrolase protein [Basidiobolus meristosporus CBS 931.73]|uniref:p-loop containing nucleoside triphosphate hydrolase protein n=1 Tax=Basidiobolus meristosporus CBS 931.73 TaxID=1314790 RepID=A0A1Y1YZT9_9FUNG|nr:P-loop containing nucleoside triphosphate hydrolase protein [Basidiobolus meristosporus CBS 931.73]|eukprot:ORY03541.1 P-loop containing nucleoside triphosphate hydrolase protein [Basidiobolus meristosporus CBS 931.73]
MVNLNRKSVVKVAARLRPNELPAGSQLPYEVVEPNTIILKEQKIARGDSIEKKHSFTFNQVLQESATQEQVYATTVKPMVDAWINQGKHAAVFAYGFTGTGKSHSLFGTEEQPGLVVLAAQELLDRVDTTSGVSLRVSMYEIAGDSCFDLLAEKNRLKVRTDVHGNIHLRQEGGGSLSRHVVTSMSQFLSLWTSAMKARRVGSSTVHDASSRSHGIVDMQVISDELVEAENRILFSEKELIRLSNEKDDILKARIKEAYEKEGPEALAPGTALAEEMTQLGVPYEEASRALDEERQAYLTLLSEAPAVQQGGFSFIDMAGNDWEKATATQTTLARAEHAAINSSLLAVKECFRALATVPTPARIPFRNSPLTQVLKRHFAPGSLLLMLATLTLPVTSDTEANQTYVRQSLNTLSYAKLVQNKK